MTETSFAPFDSLQVMAYIIKVCRETETPINVTKLQKLMYCCDGSVLAKFNIALSSERPEAWQYGPVFPKTLRFIQANGPDAVTGSDVEERAPQEVKDLIRETIEFFGKFSAIQLSGWSHKIGSPWYKASDGGMNLRTTIDDLSIKSYFRSEVLA